MKEGVFAMKSMPYLLVSLLFCGLASARADDPRAHAIAPFVDADVIAIGRLDLVKVDVDKLAHRLVTDQEQAGEISQILAPWVAALRKAGAREIYLLVALPDVLNPAHSPPPVIVPLAEGADAKAIGSLLCGGEAAKGPIHFPTCAIVHNAVFAGSNESLERVRQLTPVARPEIASAWTTLGDTGAELLLIPGPDTRRVVEEMLPNLPRELGGGPITTVSRGLSWMAIGLNQDPEPQLKAIVQGNDVAATKALNDLGKTILQYISKLPPLTPGGADFARLADDLKAEVTEDRITLAMDAQKASKWATALTVPILGAAARRQCMTNLKQIGLAFHNYADANKHFPASANRDRGKFPYSWRVAILPYINEQELFNQYRFDEPWNSPNNSKLIDRMPAIYAYPTWSGGPSNRSQTSYFVLTGDSTIGGTEGGATIAEITDGTSNTILAVESSHQIPWTKPEDIQVAPKDPTSLLPDLGGFTPEGFNVLFADGSVRFVKKSVKPDVLKALMTKNGGEVVPSDAY